MQPEEKVQLLIVAAGVVCFAAWSIYKIITAPVEPVKSCMDCGAELGDDRFFCDAECKKKYYENEQYHETKGFE